MTNIVKFSIVLDKKTFWNETYESYALNL